MTDQNRRDFTRVRAQPSVQLTAPDLPTHDGCVVDISGSGCRVRLDTLPEPGRLWNFEIALGDVRVNAEAMHTANRDGHAVLRFTSMGIDDRTHLRSLVANNAPEPDVAEAEFTRPAGIAPRPVSRTIDDPTDFEVPHIVRDVPPH